MKKLSKLAVSMVLTVAVFAGTALSGCAQSNDYTQEIKDYQAKLESLQAENEALKEQLGTTEEAAESTEAASETETETMTETVTETETVVETAPETQTGEAAAGQPEEEDDDGITRMLVLGDSIWDNCRDVTGIATQVQYYMNQKGYDTKVYNAAIGGTRATIKPEASEWSYDASSECNLGMMVSILQGDTDVELLQGKAAYEAIKEVMGIKKKIDYVVVAYGMNDFLAQAPINDSERKWIGFGTALRSGVGTIRQIFPSAQIVIVTPTYGNYFPNGVQNIGGGALYNYASMACDVAVSENLLCMDAYNNLGMDAYNADPYLEDGVHLNGPGRKLYAKGLVSCIVGGHPGTVSGNNLIFTEEE